MSTDPRFVRSADALASAVLSLASRRPVERISVTEIARAAGVTRATFYNHADSPASLLARTLERELDRIRRDFLAGAEQDPGSIEVQWRASELELVQHVREHADVYRVGLAPTSGAHGSVLADMLAGHIERSLADFAEGAGAPREGGDGTRLAMAAAFVAQGTVGALRAWLGSAKADDLDFAVDAIVAMIPPLWFDVALGQRA